MARRANATPALALLSFRPIHRLKEPTEPEGRYHYGVNRTRSQTFSANTEGSPMANEQKKFLVLFLIPIAVMDGWAKADPTEKKPPKRS